METQFQSQASFCNSYYDILFVFEMCLFILNCFLASVCMYSRSVRRLNLCAA